MKKLILLGLIVLGSSLMNASVSVEKEILELPKYKLITVLCANGYEFDYYDSPQYTAADHADIVSAGCNG